MQRKKPIIPIKFKINFKKRDSKNHHCLSSFTTPIVCEPTGTLRRGRKEYVLLQPFIYEVGALGSGLSVSVPAGFISDMASVPRGLHWLIKPDNQRLSQSAVLHDWLYLKGLVSRWICDRIFFEAMGVLKVPLWTRLLLYVTVRIFGGLFYNRNGLAEIQTAYNESTSEPLQQVIPQGSSYTTIESTELEYE